MSDFRTLTEGVLVAPQIAVDDLEAAAARGVTLVINNRPDGEAEDQPPGATIEAAARAAGLDYRAIPIGGGGFSAPQIEAMAAALDEADGSVLAFCRSGTRSTLLWALARASRGEAPEALAERAAAAGYDLAPIRPTLDMLAGRATG